MSVTGYIVLTFQFEPDDDVWVGKCVELGTATWAESLVQLEGELRDLVGLHLVTLEDNGQMGQVLDEWGVKICADMPSETSASLPVSSWDYGRELQLFQPQMFLLSVALDTMPTPARID